MAERSVFRSAFNSPGDETSGLGKRPVVFDILGPDFETSLLPEDYRLVLHVNPSSMAIKHESGVERVQTRGGFVEFHWGERAKSINIDVSTGGFMRLYTGLTSATSPKFGGTRRETIAYDKYLDLLALFHNNGSIFDSRGNIVLQGIIKLTFDGGVYLGWFTTFTVTESSEKPYSLALSLAFDIYKEIHVWRSTYSSYSPSEIQVQQQGSPEYGQADASIDLTFNRGT